MYFFVFNTLLLLVGSGALSSQFRSEGEGGESCSFADKFLQPMENPYECRMQSESDFYIKYKVKKRNCAFNSDFKNIRIAFSIGTTNFIIVSNYLSSFNYMYKHGNTLGYWSMLRFLT